MTYSEAKQYINDFLLINKPTHKEIQKFKVALKIVSALQKPN